MTQFTQQERIQLTALFPINQHEIRQGESTKDGNKIRWYIYIRKEAIISRLDDIFFGEWENGYVFRDRFENAAHHGMHLTIRGIRREFDGYNSGGDSDGESTYKGASTDAFKRVASLWGIGNYLQDAPQVWTENWKVNGKPDWDKKRKVEAEAWAKFADWLRGLSGTKPVESAPTAAQSAPTWMHDDPAPSERKSTAPFPAGKAAIIAQVEGYLDQHGLTMQQCLTALKLKSPDGLPPNFDAARKLIDSKMLTISAEVDALESADKLAQIPF